METLLATVSMKEVRTIVFSIGPYKVADSNGFLALFYRTFWKTMQNDVHS